MSHVLRGRYFLLATAHLSLAAWGLGLIRRGAFSDLSGSALPLLEIATIALPLLAAWMLVLRGCTRVRLRDEGLELRDLCGRSLLVWEALRLVHLDRRGGPRAGSALVLPSSARPTALRLDDYCGLDAACETAADAGVLERWGEGDLDDESFRHVARLTRERRFEIAGWILSALCGVGLWTAAFGLYCDRQLDLEGAAVQAVVVGKEPLTRWLLLRSGRVVYQFQVPGRGSCIGRAAVGPLLWRNLSAGDPIPVRYMSGHRVRSRPVGTHGPRLARLGLLSASVSGLFLFGVGSAVASTPLKRTWFHAG
jgi:hypothetical protein